MAEVVQVAHRTESAREHVEQPAGGAVREAGGWICGEHDWKNVCGQGQFVAWRGAADCRVKGGNRETGKSEGSTFITCIPGVFAEAPFFWSVKEHETKGTIRATLHRNEIKL